MFMIFRIGRGVLRGAGRSGGLSKPLPPLSPRLTLLIRFTAIGAALVIGVVILVAGFSRQSSADSSPGAAVVRSLPGCMPGTSHTGPGSAEDYGTVMEGGCELNDGTLARVAAWPAGDTVEQREYAAGWAPGNGAPDRAENPAVMCCVVSPAGTGPWSIALQSGTGQAPASDWAAVTRATHGVMQTRQH